MAKIECQRHLARRARYDNLSQFPYRCWSGTCLNRQGSDGLSGASTGRPGVQGAPPTLSGPLRPRAEAVRRPERPSARDPRARTRSQRPPGRGGRAGTCGFGLVRHLGAGDVRGQREGCLVSGRERRDGHRGASQLNSAADAKCPQVSSGRGSVDLLELPNEVA